MRKLVTIILGVLVIANVSHAAVTHLSAALLSHLQNGVAFKNLNRVAQLPAVIVDVCANGNGKLADPGAKWELTDVITDPALPRRRLIWAISDGDYFVVHYENGGRGHSYHILVAKVDSAQATVEESWFAVGNKLTSYEDFLVALRRNELDDDTRYYH